MPELDIIDDSLPLGATLRSLITAAPDLPIDAGTVHEPTAAALSAWLETKPTIKPTCLAGLWLLAGDLERSHQISQSINTPEGSYWHGIMHRREGDYPNARYWMRRVDDYHWVTRTLMSRHLDYHGPHAFIDWIERFMLNGGGYHVVIDRIQWLEWQYLFMHCWEEDA